MASGASAAAPSSTAAAAAATAANDPRRRRAQPRCAAAAAAAIDPAFVVAAAGTAARAIAQVAIHPLETLKLRVQLHDALARRAVAAAASATASVTSPASGGGSAATASMAAAAGAAAAAAGAAAAGARGAAAGGSAGVMKGTLLLPPPPPAPLPPPPQAALLAPGLAPEMLRGLHAGIAGAVLAAVPSGACYFLTYEAVSRQLTRLVVAHGASKLPLMPPRGARGAHHRPARRGGGGGGGSGQQASAPALPPGGLAAGAVHLAAAAAAAAASSVVRVPADVVRHRVQTGLDPSLAAAARGAWARGGGLRGLYAGWGATLARDIPELVLAFSLFAAGQRCWAAAVDAREAAAGGRQGKQQQQQQQQRQRQQQRAATQHAPPLGPRRLEPWVHMLLGGGAGAVAAACTMPLDCCKSRLQCGVGAGAGGLAGARGLASLRSAAAAIIRDGGGPHALFAGLRPRVAQAALFSAIFFAAFEGLKAELGGGDGDGISGWLHQRLGGSGGGVFDKGGRGSGSRTGTALLAPVFAVPAPLED